MGGGSRGKRWWGGGSFRGERLAISFLSRQNSHCGRGDDDRERDREVQGSGKAFKRGVSGI